MGYGHATNAHKKVQEMLEQVKLADEVGLDVFAFGEHHRPDFVITAPEIMMAGAASITKNIRLSSSVTVLSSTDPVRVFQNFATVDLLSGGRAEIMAGRGSFTESFPLFGYSMSDYDSLFAEKLDLLLKINKQTVVTWKGLHRPSLKNQSIYPRPLQESIPVWLAVGGTPSSAIRAGMLNLPMTLALLGGSPSQYVPLINNYRLAAEKAGHDSSALQLGILTQFYVAEDSQRADDEFYPSYEQIMNQVGRERGWAPMNKSSFEYLRNNGPLIVGNEQQVIDKIMHLHELFGNTRYMAQLITGRSTHEQIMKAIELYGTKVAPTIRKESKSINTIFKK
ncbi:hypothetical protein RG47T_4233 [Mucilaginibacter polytrichastri]|uniref:Luciferase-like domain-containing protein n=2 Tax=Mucilaginibacter polytrichastri TaxID=1302689 RepID=A0A1Q6A419_9SPHI|nr:hypothetical protein RG47T_4233 [Mucilaginibacter polytrichastri]